MIMQDYYHKKSAMVAIVGRPSAGKSSLMNKLCEEKISIVTPVPQTTRNRIRGIMNDERGQIVFLDTPGFHQSEKVFNRRLSGLIRGSLESCDLSLYVIDVSRSPGAEEAELLSILSSSTPPIIIAYNKIDLCPAEATRRSIQHLFRGQAERGGKSKNIPIRELEISALEETGLAELKAAIFELAAEDEALYPPDIHTDQEPEFRIAEIIREQAMLRAKEELPHALYVEILELEIREETRLWIRAQIRVESKSQVAIVVGKGAACIKAIRKASQREIGKLFPYRVHLDLRVKISHNWRKNEGIIRRITT